MKIAKITDWLTILANLGVIIGIVFLAIEINQNSELTRIQIQQERANAAYENNEAIFNSDYMPGIFTKFSNNQPLNFEENLRLHFMSRAQHRLQENYLIQINAGMLDQSVEVSIESFLRQFMSSDVVRQIWEITKDDYALEYVEFVDNFLRENSL